jgi:hypothetical protein
MYNGDPGEQEQVWPHQAALAELCPAGPAGGMLQSLETRCSLYSELLLLMSNVQRSSLRM